MRWSSLALIALPCCGRIGFDTSSDATGDANTTPPALVQSGATNAGGGSISLTLAMPTHAGDLLIVMTDTSGSASARIASLTDNAGNAYVSANAASVWAGAPAVMEIWYAPNSTANATTLTATGGGTGARDMWFLEVSGMDAVAPLDVVAITNDAPSSTLVAAPPVSPTTTRAVVVSAAVVTLMVTQIHPGNPFVSMQSENGNGAAYELVMGSGSFAAQWDNPTAGSYCASTAAFK